MNVNGDDPPIVLGRDGSGVVAKVGEDVYQVAPGDRVWFIVPHYLQVKKGHIFAKLRFLMSKIGFRKLRE